MKITNLIYITTLGASLVCLVLIDKRWRLAMFYDAKASLFAIGTVALLLLGFDVAGISWGIFFTNQAYVSGIHLFSKNLPIEEILLLALICYTTLVLYQSFKRVWHE